MILACPQCSRQYRVDRYPAGQRVRCLCGHSMTVTSPEPHAARILHCGDCGGPLPPDGTRCEYCGGVVDPDERHRTQICPRCFARIPEDARYCLECAQAIRPQEAVSRQGSALTCPRDGEPLQARAAEGIPFDECPRCQGLWLSVGSFRDICARSSQRYRDNPAPERRREPLRMEPVVYLKCPVCGTLMNRQNFGRRSGVIIDRCTEHGIWLDDRELELVARFIAEGGLAGAREAQERELRSRPRQPPGAGAGLTSGAGLSSSAVGLGAEGFLGVLGWLIDP